MAIPENKSEVYLGMTTEKRKPKPPMSKRIKFALAGTAVAAAIAGGYGIYQANQNESPGIVETVQPALTSENWQIIPQNEIKNYAKPPELQELDEDMLVSTVSPVLQEKAKSVGYIITYQGDPNDTTGRTILAKDRQRSEGNGSLPEERGFGETDMQINGIFKAWVSKPSDPQQKNEVYALLENPLTKDAYLINVSLKPFNVTNKNESTFFIVDDLNRSYDTYANWMRKSGTWMPSIFVPDDLDNPNTRMKNIEEFLTFEDLLRKAGPTYNADLQNRYKNSMLSLDNLAKPGDFINVWKQGSSTVAAKDRNGVTNVGFFVVRRFGGAATWNAEIGVK